MPIDKEKLANGRALVSGELPARVRAAYAACTDRGAALNRMERESA